MRFEHRGLRDREVVQGQHRYYDVTDPIPNAVELSYDQMSAEVSQAERTSLDSTADIQHKLTQSTRPFFLSLVILQSNMLYCWQASSGQHGSPH